MNSPIAFPSLLQRRLTSACPTYAPLKGANVIPWEVSMMGSVLQYSLNSQSSQSRVLSCLQDTVKTQSVQLRTNTESTQAAMNTLCCRRRTNHGKYKA